MLVRPLASARCNKGGEFSEVGKYVFPHLAACLTRYFWHAEDLVRGVWMLSYSRKQLRTQQTDFPTTTGPKGSADRTDRTRICHPIIRTQGVGCDSVHCPGDLPSSFSTGMSFFFVLAWILVLVICPAPRRTRSMHGSVEKNAEHSILRK